MQSTTRCLLLAALTLAVVTSCFLQLPSQRQTKITRHARGGEEVDIKVKGQTAQLTEKPKESVDLFGLVLGGVLGLAVAAGKAIESIVNKKVLKVWHPSQEVGAAEPVGYFDPLKLAKTEEKFRQYRIAEIKHGRVAMMACAGAVVQHYVKLPFLKDVPSGLQALQSTEGLIGAALLFVACGYVETKLWRQEEDKEPGNFGDPANWAQTGLGGATYSLETREKEIVNGRFAMLSIAGILAAELATGKDAVQQLTFKSAAGVKAATTAAAAAAEAAAAEATSQVTEALPQLAEAANLAQ